MIDNLKYWYTMYPIYSTLLTVMSLDVLMGLTVAFGKKEINSAISRMGVTRKAAIVILVGLGVAIEGYTAGLPVGHLVAMGFIVSEGISVTENSARVGLPVPTALTDALSKLRGGKAPPITLNLTSDASARVEQAVVDEEIAIEAVRVENLNRRD